MRIIMNIILWGLALCFNVTVIYSSYLLTKLLIEASQPEQWLQYMIWGGYAYGTFLVLHVADKWHDKNIVIKK